MLVHGLMGRGSTWENQFLWLRNLGRVYCYDAPHHRGREICEPEITTTEYFVHDLARAINTLAEPVHLIGHSMGGLHAWCLAAQYPMLVSSLVIEDMAPDFRGQTTAAWQPWLETLPVYFSTAHDIVETFSPIAGQYFSRAFDRCDIGWKLHGYPHRWIEIADQWGRRDYWTEWQQIHAPVLLLEAEYSVTPPGQMRLMHQHHSNSKYHRIMNVGHLIHDEAPEEYQHLVTEFFSATRKDVISDRRVNKINCLR